MKVTILDDYFDTLRTLDCFDYLADHEVTVWTDHVQDIDLLAGRLVDTEALVLIRERTRIEGPLLERLDALRLISLRSVFPHVDVVTCTRRGVIVSSNLHPGTPSYATAELTWALILASLRRLTQQAASLRAGHWQESVGDSLRGKTLGIYGYGRIGEVVAGYGRAFGMDVVVWASDASRERAAADGWTVAESRASFFAHCDVVTVHQRLTPATRGAITASDLALMKRTALFVNTSRAALVVPGALVASLEAGRPGRAAVDVFEDEPVFNASDPLLQSDRVLATPHIGYVTRDEWEVQFADIFEQINAFARGEPVNVINPEARAN